MDGRLKVKSARGGRGRLLAAARAGWGVLQAPGGQRRGRKRGLPSDLPVVDAEGEPAFEYPPLRPYTAGLDRGAYAPYEGAEADVVF